MRFLQNFSKALQERSPKASPRLPQASPRAHPGVPQVPQGIPQGLHFFLTPMSGSVFLGRRRVRGTRRGAARRAARAPRISHAVSWEVLRQAKARNFCAWAADRRFARPKLGLLALGRRIGASPGQSWDFCRLGGTIFKNFSSRFARKNKL